MAGYLQLPAGFTPVHDAVYAPVNSFSSIIGVITDGLSPAQSRSGGKLPTYLSSTTTLTIADWMTTLMVCDQDSLLRSGWKGNKVRFFRKERNELPQGEVGSLTVFRNLKKTIFANEPMLISHASTTFSVIHLKDIASPDFASAYMAGKSHLVHHSHPSSRAPTIEEQVHVIHLKAALGDRIRSELIKEDTPGSKLLPSLPSVNDVSYTPRGNSSAPLNAPTGPSTDRVRPVNPVKSGTGISDGRPLRSRKFSLIQDVRLNMFYDLMAQVVKFFTGSDGLTELYVTDYTMHKDLFDHVSPEERAKTPYTVSRETKDFPGPFGQRTLVIEVHPPHNMSMGSDIKSGDVVELRNVRIKFSRSGHMEGNIYADQRFPDKVLITKIKANMCEEGEQLMQRRGKYWAERTGLAAKQDGGQKMGKSARKRAKERQMAEAAETASSANRSFDVGSVSVNPHVKCTVRDIPLSNLTTLLSYRGSYRNKDGEDKDLPFVNQKRRCQVRAIDFYPPDLRDWAVPKTTASGRSSPDSDAMDLDSTGWEWNFFIMIQDASPPRGRQSADRRPELWLHVSDKAAEYLLGLDADDLNRNIITLGNLKNHMDVLCGNIRELKESAGEAQTNTSTGDDVWGGQLRNLPFECWIEEYGQPVDAEDVVGNEWDFIRIYELAETTLV